MAANPRKFSEKIALMRAKATEGDAEFHKILNEVSGITKTVDSNIQPYPGVNHLTKLSPHGAPYAPFKTGSLPNINHSLQMQQQMLAQQQNHTMSPPQHYTHRVNHYPSGGANPVHMPTQPHLADIKGALNDLNYPNGGGGGGGGGGGDAARKRGNNRQFGGAIRPTRSRTSDHSPYSPYLTPSLNGPEWKKFKSDSDIHGSMNKSHHGIKSEGGNAESTASGPISPLVHRRVTEIGCNGMIPHDFQATPGSDQPNMSCLPSHHGMPLGIPLPTPLPMGSPPQLNMQNYGSLPDLSNLGFNHNPQSGSAQSPPGNDGFGRMVSTNMPPPDSPSSIRHNGRQHSPLGGSPYFQYFPQSQMPMMMPGMLPAHMTMPPRLQGPPASPGLSNKVGVGNEVHERLRRCIIDKNMAQQYRQSSAEGSMPSPSSPSSSPMRSPESHCADSNMAPSSTYTMSPGSQTQLQNRLQQVKVDCAVSSSGMSIPYTNGGINSAPMTSSYNNSPFIYDYKQGPVKQQSIPDIVLTDADERHEFGGGGATMETSDSFDEGEMFSSSEYKTDLEPLDLEGLQMIQDPNNLLSDPSTEDQLRLA